MPVSGGVMWSLILKNGFDVKSEGVKTIMDNKCNECRYEYNKDYEGKCPLCGCKN